ncbi:MAG: hypothetical protein QM791_01840 [Ferruginibacter sp.]
MKKLFFISCFSGFALQQASAQPLFTYGNNEVSKEEFIRAFNKNNARVDDREKAMKEYITLYSNFKLKVKAARDLKLDTLSELRYDMMNFRSRLETDFPVDVKEALTKTGFKRNPAVKEDQLFRFADSVTLLQEIRKYPIEKEVIFTMTGTSVKVNEWLQFVKKYKLDREVYKGESYNELLDKFIELTVSDYYRKHLEDYNTDFKYQLQGFKEDNLSFEVMSRLVWNKSKADNEALKGFYETNKDRFVWVQCADVILVNAKYFAYADYASENMKTGLYWRKIVIASEGMIQGDSGRYEIAQLPLKPGTKLVEGEITEIVKNAADNGAGFVKVIKVYPPKLQRSFEEAKSLVINEYQQQLEKTWMDDLARKYPVKVNTAVFQSLLK